MKPQGKIVHQENRDYLNTQKGKGMGGWLKSIFRISDTYCGSRQKSGQIFLLLSSAH